MLSPVLATMGCAWQWRKQAALKAEVRLKIWAKDVAQNSFLAAAGREWSPIVWVKRRDDWLEEWTEVEVRNLRSYEEPWEG